MAEDKPIVSIITPTTGKDSLFNLIESITKQGLSVIHIVLWDDKREGCFADGRMTPEKLENAKYVEDYGYVANNIIVKGNFVSGIAAGSALRSIGLMVANTEYVMFADDDVMWEPNHLSSMILSVSDKNWAFCKRKIWTKMPDGKYEYLGVDDFESVGEEAKTPYKMVDNNCMIFRRRFGTSAAVLYRETSDYNDDRLMYDFLKKYAGEPGKTQEPSVNQVCPERLTNFFRINCTRNNEEL